MTTTSSEITRLLKAFISFKSVASEPNQKTECLDWILSTFLGENLRDWKRGTEGDCPWAYLGNSQSKLLWFAHFDVVSAREDQFVLTQDGDKVLGRGVIDMKGPSLSFLLAYRDAILAGQTPPVSILLTSDEEVAGPTIPNLLDERIITDPVAFTPDAGDTRGIVTEHKGVVWAELNVVGKSGHASQPWICENPIIKLSEIILLLQKQFPMGTEDDWQMTVTPTMISGSDTQNKIPNTATCRLDIRFVEGELDGPDAVLEMVRTYLPEGCTLHKQVGTSGLRTDSNHEMVQLFKRIATEVEGTDVPLVREHGCTDARYFSAHGIPAFIWGSEGGDLHGENEWVSVSSLIKQYEMYRRLFSEL